jgi:hypothetical protein
MFGGQPVIDRNDRHVEHPGDFRTGRIVRVEIADHETAAVEEDHDRPRCPRRARII